MTTGTNSVTEQKVKSILKKVLDIAPEKIKADARLDESLGIDSTEMVEIFVAIKKEFGIPLKDNELKKTHSLNEIVAIINSKKSAGSGHAPGCGCGH